MKGLKKSELIKIKNILDKSKYIVATWTASDFIKTLNPKKIIAAICKYIVDLNVSARAACMPISGILADETSSQALTWMTGFPSSIKHIDGAFKHDRNAFNGQKLIDEKNGIDQAVSAFKPPIFWKDKTLVSQQIRYWSEEQLKNLLYESNKIEFLIKKNSSLGNNILSDFIINNSKKTNN